MTSNNQVGFGICRELHRHVQGVIGVLIQGATRREVIDLLHLGADAVWDYPMMKSEFLARIRALHRFAQRAQKMQAHWRSSPNTEAGFSLRNYQIQIGDRRIRLSNREYRLLSCLIEHTNQTVEKEYLQQSVWRDAPEINIATVAATIHRLRMKIEADPANPQHIVTIPGKGYRFVPSYL